jgi:hypothetical protein
MTRLNLTLFALLVVLSARSLVASTFYVGTCKIGAFGTIQAAVSSASVPAGSTIDVCPGNYPEQVVISKALTLKGIFSNSSDSSQAVIAMPSAGLTTTSSLSTGSTVAAQVEVNTTGVNITGITVDGTADSANCPTVHYVGIFYASGSSGSVNEVETRNQNCSGSAGGIGIVAENGAGTAESVTIENSNVNNNFVGIWACSNQAASTLAASIKGNVIALVQFGIVTTCNSGSGGESNVSGSVSGNNIMSAGIEGVYAGSASSLTSGNTVNDSLAGIAIFAPGSITSNHISGSSAAGIFFYVTGATVKTNTITQSPIGIEFNCFTATVSGNIINGTAKGIDMVPAAFTEVNTFYNVPTVRTNGAC